MAILDQVFKAAIKYNASDIHVVPGEPFLLRLQGSIVKLKNEPLSAELSTQAIEEVLTPSELKTLHTSLQVDFAYEKKGLGRFRGSAMQHNRGLSAAFRVIPSEIPVITELGLPKIMENILENHQGLVLITGATGQGKSTTLAAMVDYLNTHRAHHILTIEDPIEFVHPLKKGVVRSISAN
jgi:twitching motility protein PilT